jgi:phosphoribosylglycinamide formyltransferase 1
MKRIAIFASGSGSNFQAIIDAVKAGQLQAEVGLMVSDRPSALVVERAAQHSVPVFTFSPKNYPTKPNYEAEILQELKRREIDFIVLAGYMRLIGSTLLQEFEGRIVNIHPSLLPEFPGKDAIGQAIDAEARVSGVTVHFVDEGMDTGPIIEQRQVLISDDETKETLQRKIQEIEHKLYPAVLQELLHEEKEGVLKNEKTSTY